MECRICGNSKGNKNYYVDEMRFGMPETFCYVKCDHCGCLQIEKYPENISRYYPSTYYSIHKKPVLSGRNFLKRLLFSRIADQCTGAKPGLSGRLLSAAFGGGSVEKIADSRVKRTDKILEIGSGTGTILVRLNKFGFQNLWGIDPFLENDILYSSEVKVLKRSLSDFDEKDFDLIFLNHTFEHMPDQVKTLERIGAMLKPDRYLIITVPIADTYTWRRYGIHWVGLSAPRHFYIHSINSMARVAEQAGFNIEQIKYKTSPFHFWASEQYQLGIPLQDKDSYYFKKAGNHFFSNRLIRRYANLSKTLDKNRDGSTAMFYLVKN